MPPFLLVSVFSISVTKAVEKDQTHRATRRLPAQIDDRINWGAILPYLKMKVRPGDATGRAGIPDDLPPRHAVSR